MPIEGRAMRRRSGITGALPKSACFCARELFIFYVSKPFMQLDAKSISKKSVNSENRASCRVRNKYIRRQPKRTRPSYHISWAWKINQQKGR
jgi:hypothetical protein